MFCINCGSKLPEGARFCSVCGVRVAETEPEEKVNTEAQAQASETIHTPLDLDFSDVKPAEAPMKTRVTFDWSNVIDEPHRKKTETIKSPWETTGSVEEKDILEELNTPSTSRSRTMSFIDVLKAEKEQKAQEEQKATEEAAEPVAEPISSLEKMVAEDSQNAQNSIEYTEVLDPGFLGETTEEKKEVEESEFKEPEMPVLHFAPLFDDVDEPVKTPFDFEESTEPEFEEPEFEEATEPEIEVPVVESEPETIEVPEEPKEEVSAPVIEDETPIDAPAEITEEPVAESSEEKGGDWFEMPGFLKISDDEDRVAFEEAPAIVTREVEIPTVEKIVEDAPVAVAEEEVQESVTEPEETQEVVTEEAPAVEEITEEAPMEVIDDSAIIDFGFEEDLQEDEEDEFIEDTIEDTTEVNEEIEETAPVTSLEEVIAASEPTVEATETIEETPAEPESEVETEEETEEEPVVEAIEEVEEEAEETETPVEEAEEPKDDVDSILDEYDSYMNIESEERVGRGHRSERYENIEDDEDDEDVDDDEEVASDEEPETFDEVPEYEEDDFDSEEIEAPKHGSLVDIEADDDADNEEEASDDEVIDEQAIFSEMEDSKPAGMTIAAPADKDSEIAALKARLAELMGVAEEPEIEIPHKQETILPEDEITFDDEPETEDSDLGFDAELASYLNMDDPTVEVAETAEEAEESVNEEETVSETIPSEELTIDEIEAEAPVVEETEEVAETPSTESSIDDLLAAVLGDAAVPAEETPEEVAPVEIIEDAPIEVPEEVPTVEIPEAEITAEELATAAAAEAAILAAEEAEEAEVPAEAVVETAAEEAKEVESEQKPTDAVSLEDLEKDLFGQTPAEDAEAETTKKIDKFYTLYRKNEEFQRLLDEEYTKLKTAGGPTPEPVLPELEPQRPVEDATIYQPLDRPLEEIAKEEAAKAAAAKADEAAETVAETPAAEAKEVVKDEAPALADAAEAAIPVAAVAAVAGAVEAGADAKAQGPEVDYEEVDKGGTFLTVIAVIIALLLVILLAVILILNFAPDSGAAIWVDSIIENITSHFSAVDVQDVTKYYI